MKRIALAGLAVLVMLPVWRTGLFVADEGWTTHIAYRLSRGEVLYRDVHSYLPPLTYWVLQGPMAIHPSLLWGRLLMLLVCGVLAFAVASLLEDAGSSASLHGVALLVLLLAAGYPSYTIPSYTGLSVACGLSAWLVWERRGSGFACGALASCAILFKQTSGLAAVGAIALAQLAERRVRSRGLLAGACAILGPSAAILAMQGALGRMLRALSPATLAEYRAMGTVPLPCWRDLAEPRLATTLPFLIDLYPQAIGSRPLWLLARSLTFGLYYAPPLAFLALLLLPRRSARAADRGLATLSCLTYLTLMPRADIAHLFQVLPPAAIVAARLFSRAPFRRWTLALSLLALTLAAALNVSRRSTFSIPLGVPRDGGLRVSPSQAPVRELLSRLRERPGEPMLAAPWGALYYFLADRPNPTRFELLLPGNIGAAAKEEIMAGIVRSPPEDIVWSTVDLRHLTPVTFESFFPELLRFRDRRYERALGPLAGEELWRRRP